MQYAAEGLKAIQPETQHPDETMHISYEDPGQRSEKEKLLMLLEGSDRTLVKATDLSTDRGGGSKRAVTRRSSNNKRNNKAPT